MLSSQDIKRQIIASARTSPFRKAMEKPENQMPDGETMEVGNALEAMTKTVGWALVSQYMERKMDVIGLITNDKLTEADRTVKRGIATAFIEMDQWIATMIAAKNKLVEKEKLKHEAKNVPEDEIDEG